jgi:hypothetical protein
MMTDQPLPGFDGPALKAAGMEQATSAAGSWVETALDAVAQLAATGRDFTSEDVIELVGVPHVGGGANRNNAVGAMMSAAAKAGLARKTGRYVEARRPVSHARVVAVWRGTRFC